MTKAETAEQRARQVAEAKAIELAEAKREAAERGKQPFDLDELEKLYNTRTDLGQLPERALREAENEYRYYVWLPDTMSLAEYAVEQTAIDAGSLPPELTDPAELALRADVLLERTPATLNGKSLVRIDQARRDLAEAVERLEQILELIPSGAERVPDEAFDTFTTRHWAELHPERYTRADLTAALTAERARLALLD